MTVTAGSVVWTGDRRKLKLGPLLKSGGTGSVYRVEGLPLEVAKIYHDHIDHAEAERKVTGMLELSPQLPDMFEGGQRYVQIAWPEALLRDEHGSFLGFLMPTIDIRATSELECILQQKQARAAGLPTGLGAKITLAANLAAVIAELHRQGHHVIDLKPVNMRFYPLALYMAMLDCDGFSIQGRGARFSAGQITPDYLAPEFQNQPIPGAGEEQQDRFALAVVIFQLLNFGIHPFTGRPIAEDVPTDIPGRIAQRYYAYGLRQNPRLGPNPGSGHQFMPSDLRVLFDRAFDVGATRPSASEWASLLKSYAQRSNQRLMVCTRDRAHLHFAGLPCAACARESLLANTARDSFAAKAASAARSARSRPDGTQVQHARNFSPRGSSSLRKSTPAKPWMVPSQPWSLPVLPGWARIAGGSTALRLWAVAVGIVCIIAFNLWSKAHSLTPRMITPSPVSSPAAAQTTDSEPSTPFAIPPPESRSGRPSAVTPSVGSDIQSVAKAMASGEMATQSSVMASLRRGAGGHPSSGTDPYQSTFARITGNVSGYSEQDRQGLVDDLELEFDQDHLNATAAYQLGWLALLGGFRAVASDWFVRAISADPGRDAAWYGYGIAANDDDDAIGAMAVAEALDTESTGAQDVRSNFPPELLRRIEIDPERFTLLQARAQRIAMRFRGETVPSDIETAAQKPLPAK